MNKNNLYVIALLLILVFTGSCSLVKFANIYRESDENKKGVLRGNTFSSGSTTYKIGLLSDGWERIDTHRGDIFFWSGDKEASITVNSVCDEDKVKYNLNALSDSLVTGIKDKEMIRQDNILIDGIDAQYREYEGMYEKTRVGIATTVLKTEKCVYDMSYSARAADFNRFLHEYLEFISGFEVVE